MLTPTAPPPGAITSPVRCKKGFLVAISAPSSAGWRSELPIILPGRVSIDRETVAMTRLSRSARS